MKLKELDKNIFQINNDIQFDVNELYSNYSEVNIYDLLKENIEKNIFYKNINIKPVESYWERNINSFYSLKNKEITEVYYNFYFTLINSLEEVEKESLLDISLNKEDKRFAIILLKNPKIRLNEKQFNFIFFPKDSGMFSLKETLIENKNINLSPIQINEGLLKWNNGLNLTYAKRGESCIFKETIDTLLNDSSLSSQNVLIELLKHKNLILNPTQIELLLTHDNFKIRAECAKNYQLPFTKKQIKRGLNDEGFEEDGFDDSYCGYYPSDIVNAFLENPNITIPEKEIENIIFGYNTHANIEILVKRNDLALNENQIDIILEKNNRASVLLLENKNIILNDQQILKTLYKDKYWPKYLAQSYLSRENVQISEMVMNVLKAFPSEEIQKVIKESLINKNNSSIINNKM